MTDESWDEQFRQFLRKTGEDFRRASGEVGAEAQRLLDAAMDPEKQQRVRDRLNELSTWARKTAQGVAGAMEDAADKAGTAFHSATDKAGTAFQSATDKAGTAFQSATDKVAEAREKMRPRSGSATSKKAAATRTKAKASPARATRAAPKKQATGAKART